MAKPTSDLLDGRPKVRLHVNSNTNLASKVDAAREAQRGWSKAGVKARLRIVRNIRHQIVERTDQLVASVSVPMRTTAAETIAAEIIPLADACRFLEHEAVRILTPRRLGRRSRPLWLRGVSVELRRDPFGVVLIIGASNYPLFLPGVQALQALAAGNAVLIKPGMGATQAAEALAETFVAAGLDENLLHVLPEEPEWVESAVEAGANKVVLTGSAQTGRSVQSLLAKSLTPATMELSGCDAVFILDSSDLGRVAKCLAFGLRFNGSATCIAPRRVFVPVTMITELERRLCDQWSSADNKPSTQFTDRTIRLVGDAISRGARVVMGGFVGDNGSVTLAAPTVLSDTRIGMELLRSDVFAPVMSIVPVASIGDALRTDRECPYALGASVFGEEKSATKVAGLIEAGCIVINDLIAPTADPRVPFGGRRESGFGVTRGAAGLEEMTQMKAIVHQRGTWLPHLDEPTPLDAKILSSYLGMSHGPTWSWRLRSAWELLRTAISQRNFKQEARNNWRSKNGQ